MEWRKFHVSSEICPESAPERVGRINRHVYITPKHQPSFDYRITKGTDQRQVKTTDTVEYCLRSTKNYLNSIKDNQAIK